MMLMMGTVFSSRLPAQTLTIRLLNAKSGKAMGKKKITVRWVKDLKSSEVVLDANGTGHVEVLPGMTEFSVMEGPRIGKEPGRVAYLDCNENSGAFLPVALVVEKGVVPGNRCGHKTTAHPGEIVFWALPIPWQPDMQ
jgi:hypothetical protein